MHDLWRRAARFIVVLVLILVPVLLLTATVVLAQANDASVNVPVKNLFDKAQVIALIGGVLIPFVVALLAKAKASMLVLSLIAAFSAGLLALGTYLTDTGGATTWEGALSVFVFALITAAASRVTITGGADTWLKAKTPNFGLG